MLGFLGRRLTYANVVSTLALVVAVGGGTAYALNGHNTVFSDDVVNGQVKTADLGSGAVTTRKVANNSLTARDIDEARLVAKFGKPTGEAAERTVLTLGGLQVRYSCHTTQSGFQPALSARTLVNNATVQLGFITGAEGAGSSFVSSMNDFDKGATFDLDRGRVFGHGSLIYRNPNGRVVTLTYTFSLGGAACIAAGTAVGG
jgi:hypothetical protein